MFIQPLSRPGLSLLSTIRILFFVTLFSSIICYGGDKENESAESFASTVNSADSLATPVPLTDIVIPESWSIHGQFTNVTQWHPGFNASYSGANSLDSNSKQANTNDATLYLGSSIVARRRVSISIQK